jgi:hypothetical protein
MLFWDFSPMPKGLKKTAAIMQPTYMPWIGYFDLMDQADVFVILDSVQFAKRSWQQRNRIKTANGELMLTVPVLTKGKREQRIDEALIEPTAQFWSSHLNSIKLAYAKAPYFDALWPRLTELLSPSAVKLADLNLGLIKLFQERLGIEAELVRGSTLAATGAKVDLLVAICRELDIPRYLSPLGSKEYIDENDVFAERGIELAYHSYTHPEYRQLHGPFLPYMSVLDLLMNEDGPRALEIIRSGRAGRAARASS